MQISHVLLGDLSENEQLSQGLRGSYNKCFGINVQLPLPQLVVFQDWRSVIEILALLSRRAISRRSC